MRITGDDGSAKCSIIRRMSSCVPMYVCVWVSTCDAERRALELRGVGDIDTDGAAVPGPARTRPDTIRRRGGDR